jgi:hypothetical protein
VSRTFLPRRCQTPAICQTRVHWTAAALERCEIRQEWARAEQAKHILAPMRRSDPFEGRRQETMDRKREEAVAEHHPSAPDDPAEQAVARNGERQLLALSGTHLATIGLLACADIYSVNEVLRRGGHLTGPAPSMMDLAGYASKQEFVDAAYAAFAAVSDAIDFDQPVRLFRGVGLPTNPDQHRPDFAGIAWHLKSGLPWQSESLDLGFAFATTDPRNAILYDGRETTPDPTANLPVLLELDAFRGICIPSPKHRSAQLFEHTFNTRFLDTAQCQVIFPPGTRWKVTSVELHSDYDRPMVRMRQM